LCGRFSRLKNGAIAKSANTLSKRKRGILMRIAIIAGLVMGLSLATLSTFDAHARESAAHAANIRPAHVSAPWFIAINQSTDTNGTSAA
jgi:formate/nitrite transporter FocA (FNT family)